MMAVDHFPRKKALLSTQRMRKKLWFFKKQARFQGFLGAVLKTPEIRADTVILYQRNLHAVYSELDE